MRLKSYTDYALRVLMHLAARPDRLATIGEIARTYRISHNHLMKVVHDLRKEGYLDSVRGRSGGVRLARPADEIRIGDVVRHTEGGFDLVDCASCVIARACSLTGALHRALAAFMAVLDDYTLADLVAERQAGLRELLASLASEEDAAAA
ncbi:MAG TPA: Rrf2 family transcriptional regulator [Sphingomicrobium sp.]|nr:Rrf2 family transcriptional regulator [Sphingomicrobium sp.]